MSLRRPLRITAAAPTTRQAMPTPNSIAHVTVSTPADPSTGVPGRIP